jgi:hypothetical protein
MNEKEDKSNLEGPIARSAKHIAYFFIVVYATCLVIILFFAFYEPTSGDRIWYNLFKSGFLLLGGALTTIIGYYFGSRGTQEAERSAKIAERDTDRINEELKANKREVAMLKDQLAPTFDEISLEPIEPAEEE